MSDEYSELRETLREINNTLRDEQFLAVDARFRRLLGQAMTTLGLGPQDIARSLNIEEVVVRAWIAVPRLTPCLSTRRDILGGLRRDIEQHLRHVEWNAAQIPFDAVAIWNIQRPSPDAAHEERMAWHREFAARHAPR